MPSQAMIPTPMKAKKAAIQEVSGGRSPVTQGLRSPVNNGEDAPITEIAAVLTMVSEVT